jgi:hypothetical protein
LIYLIAMVVCQEELAAIVPSDQSQGRSSR